MHNFKDSLAKGKAGETLLIQHMPWLQKLDGRQSDFLDTRDGSFWELKTDSYDATRTPNLFIECLSDIERNKPGGPVQALSHNSTTYVYLFPKNKICFLFNTQALVDAIPEVTAGLELKLIRNRGWTTSGWAVPRARLKHLYTEVHFE